MEPTQTCPSCKTVTPQASFFCPNCGRKLRKKPIIPTLGKQIQVYLVSFFLPPLGLWWGIPLLLQNDSKSKIVGIVSILLTILSVFISFRLFADIFQSTSQQLNQLNGLGY